MGRSRIDGLARIGHLSSAAGSKVSQSAPSDPTRGLSRPKRERIKLSEPPIEIEVEVEVGVGIGIGIGIDAM